MPRSAPAPTREQVEQQAADLAARAAALREQLWQQDQQQLQRQAQAERDYDEQQAAAFSRADLDAEVEAAREVFDAQIADTPLVRAMADYLGALQHRRTAVYEHTVVLGRLGPDTAGAQYPRAELGPVEDIVAAAVQRVVTARIDAERAAAGAARDAAIAAATANPETP